MLSKLFPAIVDSYALIIVWCVFSSRLVTFLLTSLTTDISVSKNLLPCFKPAPKIWNIVFNAVFSEVAICLQLFMTIHKHGTDVVRTSNCERDEHLWKCEHAGGF